MRFLLVTTLLFVLLCSAATAFGAEACREQDSCDEGQAWAAAQEYMQRKIAEFNAAKTDPDMKWVACPEKTTGQVSGVVYYLACRNGAADARETFHYKGLCSVRPEQTTWKAVGGGSGNDVCNDGCRYSGSLDASSPTGITYAPTGGTCSNGEFPSPESADPGEGEPGGGGGGTDPGGGGGGDGGGTDPGGGGGGGGGTGPGEGGGGDGDGDGDGGGGGGVTPGPGDGGTGGAAGPTTGRLYKKSGKTMEKVLAEFKSGLDGAPILSKVKGFFGSCTGSGSCPSASWDGGQYAGKFDLGTLCSGPLLALFQYAGFVFLAGTAVVALRWALL